MHEEIRINLEAAYLLVSGGVDGKAIACEENTRSISEIKGYKREESHAASSGQGDAGLESGLTNQIALPGRLKRYRLGAAQGAAGGLCAFLRTALVLLCRW